MSTQPHDEALHPRETTGKFATKPTSEASGGLDTLSGSAETAETLQRQTHAEATALLAGHFGLPSVSADEHFDLDIDGAGASTVVSEIAIPGDPHNTCVEFSAELDDGGRATTTAVTITYDIPTTYDNDNHRGGVSIETTDGQAFSLSDLPATIELAQTKARIQRRANALINTPQRAIAAESGRESSAIVEVEVGTPGPQTAFTVTDRSLRDSEMVEFTFDQATGRLVSARTAGRFGAFILEGENLATAAAGAHRALVWNLGEQDALDRVPKDQWQAELEARFGQVLSD